MGMNINGSGSALLAVIALCLSLATAGGTLLERLFVGKTDYVADQTKNVEVEKEKAEEKAKSKHNNELQDWRIQVLEVRVENMSRQLRHTSQNVVRLLTSFKLQPAPEPVMKPVPESPSED